MTKVITHHEYPPIPSRNHDWCAYIDGEEEEGNYGWGRTEAQAVVDMAIKMADQDNPLGLIAAIERLLDLEIRESEQDGRNTSYISGLKAAQRTVVGIL